MNRYEFLNKLALELGRLPRDEAEDILAYYNEYFDDAGSENEAQALEELGSPVKIATQIKADYAVKQLDRMPQQGRGGQSAGGRYVQSGQSGQNGPGAQGGQYGAYGAQGQPQPRKRVPVALWVILGIFAAPVALPVAIAAGVTAIALFAVLGALALAGLITVGALFAGGILCVVVGFAALFQDFVNAILVIGIGLAIIGSMLLLGLGIIVAFRALFRLIVRKANESRKRRLEQSHVKKAAERQDKTATATNGMKKAGPEALNTQENEKAAAAAMQGTEENQGDSFDREDVQIQPSQQEQGGERHE